MSIWWPVNRPTMTLQKSLDVLSVNVVVFVFCLWLFWRLSAPAWLPISSPSQHVMSSRAHGKISMNSVRGKPLRENNVSVCSCFCHNLSSSRPEPPQSLLYHSVGHMSSGEASGCICVFPYFIYLARFDESLSYAEIKFIYIGLYASVKNYPATLYCHLKVSLI